MVERGVNTGLAPTHALLLLAVTAIWGSNFVVIKVGLVGFDPMLLAVIRFAIATFPLILLFPKPPVALSWLALNGLMAGAGQFGLLFWAMKADVSPGLASLLMQMQVFFTIAMARFAFGEPVSTQQRAGLALGALGLTTVALHLDASMTPLGFGLVMGAAACWAGSNVLAKFVGKQYLAKIDMLSYVVWSSAFALVAVILIDLMQQGFASAWRQVQAAGTASWMAAAWQAIGNTLIGFVSWNAMMTRYPAALVSPWALLVPVFGLSTATYLVDESMPAWKLLAGVLVLIGIGITTWPSQGSRRARAVAGK